MTPLSAKNSDSKLDTLGLLAGVITLIYFFFEEFLFGLPNTFDATQAGSKGTLVYLVWLSTLLAGLFFLFLWFLWSLKAKPAVRIVYGVIFAAGVLSQYTYWSSVHRLIKANDIALLGMTNTNTWQAAITLYFSWRGLLICIPYVFILFVSKHIQETGWKELFICLIFIFSLSFITVSQKLPYSFGTSFPEILHSLGTFLFSNINPIVREKVSPIPGASPDKNIVLIIDESIRSDHLSINGYQRATTPYLEKLTTSGNLYNWGTISAGGTCSYISNQLTLTGILPSENAIDIAARSPTIFQYAHAAGYKMYYLDAQTDYLWDGLTPTDLKDINWINTRTLGTTFSADLNAAQIILDIVKKSTGNFIVLNKRGVHFMYEDSYPPASTIWTPLPPKQDYLDYPELVKNSYDNGVRYNVDEFFRTLLPDNTTLTNTIYIYTSDHAQTLFEDGVSWSHCNYTIKEDSVPFIIIGKLATQPDTTYPASHANILPTILGLMNYPVTAQTSNYQSSLLADIKKPLKRNFLDGAMRVNPFDK